MNEIPKVTGKTKLKIGGYIALFMLLSLGFTIYGGYADALFTRTAGVAQQDAQREVFENTQSYTQGKRQEASKLYKEYMAADATDKVALKEVARIQFANFDESKYLEGPIRDFIYDAKY